MINKKYMKYQLNKKGMKIFMREGRHKNIVNWAPYRIYSSAHNAARFEGGW